MPIGGLNRDTSTPKRETFRPPWVKDNTTDAPPSWMQKKLKPVESTTKTMNVASDESTAVGVKPTLRPVLKKQSTIKDKSENGVSEKIIMPSERLAKQRSQEKVKPNDKENKPTDKVTKPIEKVITKSGERAKVAETAQKPSEKVTNPKTAEKVTKPAETATKQVERVAKPTETTENSTRPVNKFRKASENTNNPAATEKVTTPSVRKAKSPEKVTKPTDKDSTAVNSINKKKVDVKPATKEEKLEEKPKTMATKPPTSLDKSPSKNLPPRKPSIQKQPSRDDIPVKKWRDPLHERVKENIDKTLNEVPKGHTLTKNESLRSLLKPTPPPMPPPMPPKAPPPPDFMKPQLTPEKLKKIEQLKSRPRKRPDWTDMMKEVESGKKLKHVVCNDRSSPVITRAMVVKTKEKGEFIFESEKNNKLNDLLKEINQGIKLKKTKTNDRSKPNLEGLRKFRRQMTIEEQLQKSMSHANLATGAPSKADGAAAATEIPEIPPEDEEIDEMDDIDKVRDDLQSTKQLLAIELRNKEAQERENKRLLNKIQNLEAELARERAIILQEQQKTVISVTDAYDERLVVSLKSEVDRAKATADDLEKRYLQAAEERDDAQTELEEVKRRNAELEKKLQQAYSQDSEQEEEPMSYYVKRQLDFKKQCDLLNVSTDDPTQPTCDNNYHGDQYEMGVVSSNVGSRRSSHAIKQMSIQRDSSFEEEEEESSEEEEESEEKKQKRMEKEVKNMRNKIRHLKEKQDRMKQERVAYKMSLKNQQAALKDAKKKYKTLKLEVKKMAAMMKDEEDDEDEDDESEEEEEDEKKDSESEEEESETETEADTESETESESEPEDAPLPKKKENLSSRLKRHESRVTALKKGNTLLIANVDRLKDDVNKQREESAALQKELDSLVDDFA